MGASLLRLPAGPDQLLSGLQVALWLPAGAWLVNWRSSVRRLVSTESLNPSRWKLFHAFEVLGKLNE
jgi:hypothetical protein